MRQSVLSQDGARSVRPFLSGRLSDTSGASLVVALLFFVLCSIIGGVVLSAAVVQAHQSQVHQRTQAANYAVSCAASLVADQFSDADLDVISQQLDAPRTNPVTGEELTVGYTCVVGSRTTGYGALTFWEERYGAQVMAQVMDNKRPFVLEGVRIHEVDRKSSPEFRGLVSPVEATITVEEDFSLTFDLTALDDEGEELYRAKVSVPCSPTYGSLGSSKGVLTKLSYGKAVVE